MNSVHHRLAAVAACILITTAGCAKTHHTPHAAPTTAVHAEPATTATAGSVGGDELQAALDFAAGYTSAPPLDTTAALVARIRPSITPGFAERLAAEHSGVPSQATGFNGEARSYTVNGPNSITVWVARTPLLANGAVAGPATTVVATVTMVRGSDGRWLADDIRFGG